MQLRSARRPLASACAIPTSPRSWRAGRLIYGTRFMPRTSCTTRKRLPHCCVSVRTRISRFTVYRSVVRSRSTTLISSVFGGGRSASWTRIRLEHLAWCSIDGRYLNDLLPLPYTDESLGVVCEHVSEAQDVLQRALLVENPARYLAFRHSAIPEDEFLRELSARTGCGLLCDVNNVHVSAFNLGFDAVSYLHSLPAHAVREIHLAGHALVNIDGRELLIDDHGSRVKSQVGCLYAEAVQRFGNVPTLIEWDNGLPDLDVLLSEADKARTCQTEISPERQDGKRTSKIVPSPI